METKTDKKRQHLLPANCSLLPGKIKPRRVENVRTGFRFKDFLIIVLCLLVMLFFVNRFRLDLNQTISLNNVEPVGTISIKQNTVQRRIANRVLWDRLRVESPVYLGDIIRVADLSAATLHIEGQHIDLDENTLIRIQLSPEGALQVELAEGSLGVTTGEDSGGLRLNLMGRVVEAGAGTALVASVGTSSVGAGGLALQVNEGSARILPDAAFAEEGREGSGGKIRELTSGGMIAFDSGGAVRLDAAAVITQPRPNARYVKDTPEPLSVAFAWNRVNLGDDESLRLEIAADRGFSRIVQSAENLASSAEVGLEAGVWNWRLLREDAVLSAGRLSVTDGNIGQLSPARGSLFIYQSELPSLRFQWSEIEEASGYVIEAAPSPDFSDIVMSREATAPFFVDSGFGEGTWYWRVRPVFSTAYTGEAGWSPASFFRVERGSLEPGASAAGAAAVFIDSEQLAELERELNPVEPDPEPAFVSEPGPEPIPEPAPPPQPPPPPPLQLRLVSPSAGTAVPGLTALRNPTEFRWDSNREVARSRFVLSGNSNPLRGAPVVEILNPGRIVSVDRLEEGLWYWTVEARAVDGTTSAPPARQFRVQPIPVLPAPENREPADGFRIDIEYLRTQRSIEFNWAPVQGANAYIITLYEEIPEGRRQINGATVSGTSWSLDDARTLQRGTFIWQIEAVNRNPNGVIEQRGTAGANSFVMDIPLPEVQAFRPGVLYGVE